MNDTHVRLLRRIAVLRRKVLRDSASKVPAENSEKRREDLANASARADAQLTAARIADAGAQATTRTRQPSRPEDGCPSRHAACRVRDGLTADVRGSERVVDATRRPLRPNTALPPVRGDFTALSNATIESPSATVRDAYCASLI
jgi:hypothetical protein